MNKREIRSGRVGYTSINAFTLSYSTVYTLPNNFTCGKDDKHLSLLTFQVGIANAIYQFIFRETLKKGLCFEEEKTQKAYTIGGIDVKH